MAAVLGSVLTFLVIERITRPPNPVPGPGASPSTSSAPPHECLDASATVLAEAGRKAGPVRRYYARPANEVYPDRPVSVREDLASYRTEQEAAASMTRFRDWIARCRKVTFGAFSDVVSAAATSFENHGDETLAATVSKNYALIGTARSGRFAVQEVVVVVRVHRTVCLFYVASQEVAFPKASPMPPASAEVNAYVTDAIRKLMSLT